VRAVFTRRQAIRDAALWALARVPKGDDRALPVEDAILERDKIDYRRLVREAGGDPVPPRGGPASPSIDPAIVGGQGPAITEALTAALASGRRDVTVRTLRDLDSGGDTLAFGPLPTPRDLAAAVAPAVASPLDKLCEDKDPEVRAAAVPVLAKTGDARAPARIARLLGDESREVRIAAIRAAQSYAAPRGGGELAELVARRLTAPDGLERTAAAEALGRIPGADLTPLVASLSGSDGFVREAAVRALGARAQTWVKPLLDATRDEVAEVRLAAVQVLRPLPDPTIRSRLREMAQSDPSAAVRKEAVSKVP